MTRPTARLVRVSLRMLLAVLVRMAVERKDPRVEKEGAKR